MPLLAAAQQPKLSKMPRRHAPRGASIIVLTYKFCGLAIFWKEFYWEFIGKLLGIIGNYWEIIAKILKIIGKIIGKPLKSYKNLWIFMDFYRKTRNSIEIMRFNLQNLWVSTNNL